MSPFDLEAVGRPGEQHRYDVTEEALRAYAEATGGRTAGPVFAIVPAWETIPAASRSVASDEARRRIVHAAQDIHLHAPIEAGMTLVAGERRAPTDAGPQPGRKEQAECGDGGWLRPWWP